MKESNYRFDGKNDLRRVHSKNRKRRIIHPSRYGVKDHELVPVMLSSWDDFAEFRVPGHNVTHREGFENDLRLSCTIGQHLQSQSIVIESKPRDTMIFDIGLRCGLFVIQPKFDCIHVDYKIESSPTSSIPVGSGRCTKFRL